MSNKHFNSNGANVKLVQNRKPLARAIALALMAAVPVSAWAAPKLELISQVNLVNDNAVTVQGNYAYTGDGTTLKIFDVSNPANPTVVGTSAPMPDSLMEVVIKGNYAYVANARGGLRILDISNPQHPFEVGVYNTNQPNDSNDWTLWGVDVRDNYAYVADMGSGLRIVDVSNPANPVEVGFYDTPSLAHAVKLNGNFAYVVDWSGGLRIVDITDPKSPKEVSFIATGGLTYGVDFSKDGKLAYIADYNGLRIVDISNPQSPKDVSFFGTPGIAISVVADGNYVYMNSYSELKVLDVSNPQSPQQVDSYNAPDNGSGYGLATRFKLNNGFLYAPNRDGGLLILSNGETPPSSACGGVTNGLVACYPFDGNANDGSGNANHGTVNGGVTLTTDRFGKANSAYLFDGVDDYIRIKNSDTLNPKQITVSAWYFATKSFSGDGNNVIIHKPYTGHTPPYYQWHLGVGGDQYNNSGNFSFDGWTAIPTAFATGGKKIATAEVVGKWHHITTSFDGTIIRVYIDGKLETVSTTLPNSSPISSYNTDVFIGKHGNLSRSQIDYTPGIIDDIRIYNRALTEAEIKQLYGASTEIVATPPASICAGSTFNVTIRVNKKDAQPIDGAELTLKFDKSKLKVNSVTNSGVLDTVVVNNYDNATGNITFSAGAWDKPAPTSAFDLFTINFTALSSTAGTTLLDFLDNSIMLTSGGETVNVMATDNTLTLNQCLNYKVDLQRAKPISDASWVTDLKASLGSATSAVEYPTTCKADGTGTLVLSKPVVAGDYICVKNSHTLANKVVQSFGNPVNFGTLLEGDATNNNTVDALDFSFLTNHKGCKGAANTKYDPQADFNVSSCVDAADLALYRANYKKPSACKWNATSKMYRRGERDGGRNAITLSTTTLPTGLTVGDSFAYTVQVNANEAQAADGAAVYLNFDPTQLQVNGLTTGQSFDVTIENTFDNTKGEINFAAGVWDNPAPTQTVELVTINLTVLQNGGEQTLAFSTTEDRQTMIAGGGEEVTALSEDGEVVVEPVTITPPPVTNYSASGKLFAEPNMPLAGATVQIDGKTAVTDQLGNWKIDGLTNGTYTATATKNGHTIPSQQAVINGENLTFDFGVVYTAYGTLKNDQKQPVAGATITIGDKQTQTDATGFWKLDGLPAGESTLVASKDGYKFAPEKFMLGAQEPNKEILVTPASTLVLKAKPTPWQAIRQGENVTYTYTLFNGGTQTATGITFTETVPPGAKLVSLKSLGGGDCQADTLTCTLPDLTAGATAQVELVLQATDGNSIKNIATATTNEYPADVQTSYKTVKPYLSVTVTDNHDPVEMLTDLHYTATVELSPLAPVDTAKDINLVMQLPKGLELKTVTTAAGTCDSSQFPLINCQLPNLSIATPDSVSQTAVNVDVTLKDAGLLVLTNEAKVTASNYPTHTVRERTNIFIPDHIKIDLVMVIDTTNSMAPEINGVKAAIDQLIATVPAGQRPTMALVEFKDDVRVKAFTQDTNVMLGAVAKLVAEGGGTCPEASAEALAVALKHLKDGGTILLATDASPYPEANLEELVKRLQSGNLTFNAIISGDCTGEGDVNEMTK